MLLTIASRNVPPTVAVQSHSGAASFQSRNATESAHPALRPSRSSTRRCAARHNPASSHPHRNTHGGTCSSSCSRRPLAYLAWHSTTPDALRTALALRRGLGKIRPIAKVLRHLVSNEADSSVGVNGYGQLAAGQVAVFDVLERG